MSDQPTTLPPEWKAAAAETVRTLSVARAIEKKQYPDGNAPAGLLPALVVVVAICRFTTENGGGDGHVG